MLFFSIRNTTYVSSVLPANTSFHSLVEGAAKDAMILLLSGNAPNFKGARKRLLWRNKFHHVDSILLKFPFSTHNYINFIYSIYIQKYYKSQSYNNGMNRKKKRRQGSSCCLLSSSSFSSIPPSSSIICDAGG